MVCMLSSPTSASTPLSACVHTCAQAHYSVCDLATIVQGDTKHFAGPHRALCWNYLTNPTNTAKSYLSIMTPHPILLRAQFSRAFIAFNILSYNQLWRWHLLWPIVSLKGRKHLPMFISSATSTSAVPGKCLRDEHSALVLRGLFTYLDTTGLLSYFWLLKNNYCTLLLLSSGIRILLFVSLLSQKS